MKRITTILLLFCSLVANATNYYVSNAGDDSNDGLSTSTAWQTLSKVNSYTFSAGDNIFLKRGDVFYGNIVSSKAGRSGNPVTYSSYGTGTDLSPVVSGFATVSGWTNLGGNIWQSTSAVSTLSTLNRVIIDGINTPMGKYPNSDASYPFLPNFYTFQSITGSGNGASSITSSSLSGGTDWTGADVVIRVSQWAFHREIITSQSGTTLSFSGGAGGLESGWGFFIQNDIRTLDQQGEWYYNPSTKKISIYSTMMPTDVQVSTIDTLFRLDYSSGVNNYTTIDHINFEGANTHAIWVSGTLSCSITNCNINYSGLEGLVLYGGGIVGGDISNNTFYGTGSSGLYTTGDVEGLNVTNNTVSTAGIISVYKQNDYSGAGVALNATGSLFQYNSVDSSSYCGLTFRGANIKVRNNFINHSAIVRGDAAGIYTGFASETGKVIDSNIVFNSIGNPRGAKSADYFAFGIYIDDLGTGIEIKNNTMVNCRTGGLYLHNSNNLTIRNNTIYNCGSLAGESMWANGGVAMDANTSLAGSVHDNVFTNNTIFAVTPYQYALNYYAESGSNGDVSHFGTIDSNYYVKVNGLATVITSNQTGINGEYSLTGWKSASSKDAHTQTETITDASNVALQYNATTNNVSIDLGAKYADMQGNLYNGTLILSPYTSAILLFAGALDVAPASNAIQFHGHLKLN